MRATSVHDLVPRQRWAMQVQENRHPTRPEHWNTSVWPTVGCGISGHGPSPNGKTNACKNGCTTSNAVVQELRDLGIAIPYQTVKDWIGLSLSMTQEGENTRREWHEIELQERWSSSRIHGWLLCGPLTATIPTLRGAQWDESHGSPMSSSSNTERLDGHELDVVEGNVCQAVGRVMKRLQEEAKAQSWRVSRSRLQRNLAQGAVLRRYFDPGRSVRGGVPPHMAVPCKPRNQ